MSKVTTDLIRRAPDSKLNVMQLRGKRSFSRGEDEVILWFGQRMAAYCIMRCEEWMRERVCTNFWEFWKTDCGQMLDMGQQVRKFENRQVNPKCVLQCVPTALPLFIINADT